MKKRIQGYDGLEGKKEKMSKPQDILTPEKYERERQRIKRR